MSLISSSSLDNQYLNIFPGYYDTFAYSSLWLPFVYQCCKVFSCKLLLAHWCCWSILKFSFTVLWSYINSGLSKYSNNFPHDRRIAYLSVILAPPGLCWYIFSNPSDNWTSFILLITFRCVFPPSCWTIILIPPSVLQIVYAALLGFFIRLEDLNPHHNIEGVCPYQLLHSLEDWSLTFICLS